LLLCSIPGQWSRSRGARGAHVYVCGDAKRMAKDVEGAWVEIIAAHGARTTDEAVAFVANLKKSGRYQQAVY
jgi:sulfite reductase (NADPH) flavoprotein alpha-component